MKKLKTDGTIKEILGFEPLSDLKRPLIGYKIPAGFPSPAQDFVEEYLDLNKYLISHPSATYFVRVEGNSMINAGVYSGDILIVDRSLEPVNNKIVVAILEGELTVKRLKIKNGKYYLLPENPDYKSLEIEDWMDMTIWGVVTYVIHQV